jgi:EmrB/QacA subfamily drug resistance transporter
MKRVSVPKNVILAIVGVAQLMDILDMAIVNVALPSIFRELRFTSLTSLQWVTSAYVLAYGGFLILGGRAADLFGRRRVFIAGTAVFALASLATGVAQDSLMIEISRGLQGLSAAFMSPAALSILLTTFTGDRERNRALGIWGAIGASGAVAGAVLGGVITTYLGWRWNFFINIFIGAAVAAATLRFVPPDPARAARERIDALGASLVTSALLLIVYALTQAPAHGWGSPQPVTGLAAGAALLGGFALHETRTVGRLVPFDIFAVRNLAAGDIAYLGNVAAFAAVFFFPTLYLQDLLGFSPLKTGLAFLPLAVVVGATAALVSRLVSKAGYKWPMVAGSLVAAAGLVLLAGMAAGGTYLGDVLPGFLVTGAGVGATMVAATIAATSAAPREEAGLASALLASAQQLGFALGYAVLAGVASSATASYVASHPHAPGPLAQVHGYRSAFLVAAAVAAGCALFALAFVRWRRGDKVQRGGQREPSAMMRRPAMDTLEVRHPGLAAHAVRVVLRMPGPVRRRGLASALDRAQAAFNRGDFQAVLALFADDVDYVPPPPLSRTPIRGRSAVLRFWQAMPARYQSSTITNLSVEETSPGRFVRTARLSHAGPDSTLQYVIRQTTQVRRGRVVRQVNETLEGA